MKIYRIYGLVLLSVFLLPLSVFAYNIETIPGTPVVSDFVIGPGKIEVQLKPGQSAVSNMVVTNRMGDKRTFTIETEDFTGSRNVKETIVLLGDKRGPYTLKDYIKVQSKTFTLEHGQRATIPVTISVPLDAEPGGRYGSILFSMVSRPATDPVPGVAGGSAVVARLGTLIFVRIPGPVKEDGKLTEFNLQGQKNILSSGPINFELLFENNGSVHLNPYGEVKIKNLFNQEIGSIDIEPWFSLPDSLRLREFSWEREFLFGRYSAIASIERGYGDQADQLSLVFWVLPWKLVLLILLIIIIAVGLVRWIFSKIEIRRK